MELTQEAKQHFTNIADDSLLQFEKVADAARNALTHNLSNGGEAFASVNTMTSSAVQNLGKIHQENRESYQILSREPAIARVVVANKTGKQTIYYICRTTPVSGIPNLTSYRAPVGRLASLNVGDDFSFPNGTVVEVLEKVLFTPSFTNNIWDSRNNIIEVDDTGPITIESLRALFSKALGIELDEDLLEQILDQENQTANIFEGIRKSVITKMELRDQPVLDQYQDEIFRLPLDQRLLILGPPGTGKTTTLIRRLGQKLDTFSLGEDEQRIIESLSNSSGLAHANSWLMFTPTELLKQYLKEAFNREDLPASDHRIKTWADYRKELARRTFGLLKTATGGGSYILKDSIVLLSADAETNPIDWFTDFNEWQRAEFLDEIQKSAIELSENELTEVAAIGEHLLSNLQNGNGSLANIFTSLIAQVPTIQKQISGMKELTDKKIRGALILQLNRDKTFIDELATFLDGLQQTSDVEIEDVDDQENEEEEISIHKTARTVAISSYSQAVSAHARSHVSKRSLGKKTRNAKIIEWLGDRGLKEADIHEIGTSLIVQTSGRRFVNPVKRYLDSIPKRYRAFRRLRQEQGKWYHKDGFNQSDLHPLELDIILLSILRAANDLISKPNILREIDQPVWSSLKPVLDLYKNQILVDEATDFSPIQIGCMAALAHPRLRSFFACGDFNQRLTTWGSHSIEQIQWVFPEIGVKEITVSYRQSRQLNDLARAFIKATGGSDDQVTLPKHVDNDGVAPALLEDALDSATVIDWLAERIREIERYIGQLPSIAVFVDNEFDVQIVADALNTALVDENIQVVACKNGQVIGQDNAVRVFDIQHIKGLEFEAVFFIGIDRLASQHPQLFDKYLYVGTTRAATYLGITCDKALPAAISSLRPMFVSDWNKQ